MASLEELPDELVVSIVEYLTHPSLSRFSRVNRRFHGLTVPSLYATFAGPKAQQFLRTITTSPLRDQYKLAKRVKKVQWRAYIQGVGDPTGTRARIKRCIPNSERQPIIQAYQELGLQTPSESIEPSLDISFAKSFLPFEHWFLDFFLSFVPDVEHINIYDAWHWDHGTRWFAHLAINADRFQSLNTVVIHGPMRFSNIIPLLTVPTLRSLELHLVLILRLPRASQLLGAEQLDEYNLSPSSLQIEHLAIKRSYLSSKTICDLLDSIKSLKSFTYEHKRHKLSYPRESRIIMDYSHLGAALKRHPRLVSLRLHDKHDAWLTGLQHILTVLPNLEELDIKLPHHVSHAVAKAPDRPYQIDFDTWLESYFPPAPLRTLKLRSGSSSSSFLRSFQQHCNTTACKQPVIENALNSVVVLRALARRGLRRVCVAIPASVGYSWQSFQFTKRVYWSAGLKFNVVDYED